MSESSTHESVFELLPWYVNGTLAAAERALVESHLRTCLTCRLELKRERRVSDFVRGAPTVDLSPETGFEQLSRALDGNADSQGHRPRPGIRVPGIGSRAAPRLALAATLLAAIGGIVWALVLRPVPTAPAYVTLTGAPAPLDHLDLIFADGVTEADMRDVLGVIDATIVAGPTGIGRYTVRLDDSRLDDEELATLIRSISTDGRVRFVGPAPPAVPEE